MGHSKSKLPQPQIRSVSTLKPLPSRIDVSYEKSWTKLVLLLKSPNSDITYAINLPLGWWGPLTLHESADVTTQPLATMEMAGKWLQDYSISLPVLRPDGQVRSEIVRWAIDRKIEVFWFALEIGDGANKRIEKFEWRRSHGSEVKSLGKSSYGWKLVRVGNPDAETVPIEEPNHVDGITSDGKEVVAAWAPTGYLGMTDIGTFEVRGSGATGELGSLWSIVAIMSCMSIWIRYTQLAVNAGNASVVAATTAAAIS